MQNLKPNVVPLPRHFWHWPEDMRRPDEWLENPLRYVGEHHHPEIAYFIERTRRLLNVDMTREERRQLYAVEEAFRHAFDDFQWFLRHLNCERLLPDTGERPDLTEIDDIEPSRDSLGKLLGALHRASTWIEKLEAKYGLEARRT